MRSFASSLVVALGCAGCFSPAPADHLYRCASASQCPSGYGCAVDGYCYRNGHVPMQSNSCSDGLLDGDETGVDCGGPTCPARCPLDAGCAAATDCASSVCNSISNVCVADDCHDGMRDDAESDVDCGGGSCPGCGADKACRSPGDCASLLCNQTSHTCVTDPCFDGVKDQTETDVDCGGLCLQKCKNSQGCNAPPDCVPGATCASNKCQVPHCVDGTTDNGETDIDCGGPDCSPCPVGKACLVGGDCASTFCSTTHLCVASQCQDGIKDGGESDVDCGGPTCPRCADGGHCSGAADCTSGSLCTGGSVCCHPSGTACNGIQCGTVQDNCGQTFACGNNGQCADTTLVCASGCCATTMVVACTGKQCGSVPDGCGTNYDCGTCTGGKACSNAPSFQCCDNISTVCTAGVNDCQQVATSCGTITCPCSTGGVCYAGACCTPTCTAGCYSADNGCGGTCPGSRCTSPMVCCYNGVRTGCFASNMCRLPM